jgi:hypothetical protein
MSTATIYVEVEWKEGSYVNDPSKIAFINFSGDLFRKKWTYDEIRLNMELKKEMSESELLWLLSSMPGCNNATRTCLKNSPLPTWLPQSSAQVRWRVQW